MHFIDVKKVGCFFLVVVIFDQRWFYFFTVSKAFYFLLDLLQWLKTPVKVMVNVCGERKHLCLVSTLMGDRSLTSNIIFY